MGEKKENLNKEEVVIEEIKEELVTSEEQVNATETEKADKEKQVTEVKPKEEVRQEAINSDEITHQTVKVKSDSACIKKAIFGISIAFIILLAIFLVLSTVFALIHSNNDKIISGIYINGINVSGLTKQEAIDSLSNNLSDNTSKMIKLKHGDFESSIMGKQISASFDIVSSVDVAYQMGRNGSLIQNNYCILSAMMQHLNIEPILNYNDQALTDLLNDLSEKLPDRMIQSSYYIEEDHLVITRGKSGSTIDIPSLKQQILAAITNPNATQEIVIPTHQENPDPINIDKIYQEVHKEAVNAHYTTDPFVVYPHVNGLDFNLSLEDARALLQEEKEEYIIPLITLYPSITTNQIGTEAFPDLLSSFSTKYVASNVNRSTNLRLATEKINGTVLLPGETFSYNKTVGKRTIEAGFKDAAIFQGGKVVDGLGGGICQISSTLYEAALYANLEIIERSNHGFVTSYLGAGLDATVVYGAIDFQFKNNRNYPIKIVGNVSGGIAEFKIFGKKEEVEYDVEITTKRIATIPFKVRYVNDASLAQGKTKVLQGGSNGCKTETYKILKQNGEVVSTTLISRDTYNAMEKIIAKGTKK